MPLEPQSWDDWAKISFPLQKGGHGGRILEYFKVFLSFFLSLMMVSLLSPTSSRISNKNKLGQEDLESTANFC